MTLPDGLDLVTRPARGAEPDDVVRAWLAADEAGFHQQRADDTSVLASWAHVVADSSRLRGVYSTGRPRPLQNPEPVATFRSFDGTVNTGAVLAPSNFVADVTVRPSHRRRGILRAMMTTDLAEARERGLPFASLTASEGGIYQHFGFGVASVGLRVRIPRPREVHWWGPSSGSCDWVTVDDAVAVRHDLFERWHATTRGSHSRSSGYRWWLDSRSIIDEKPGRDLYTAVHVSSEAAVDGLITYRFSSDEDDKRELVLVERLALDASADLALWRHACAHDLVAAVVSGGVAPASPLFWASTDVRAVRVDGRSDEIWLRVLDVPQALAARGWEADGEVVLRVIDPMGFADGTWRVTVRDGRAEVAETGDEAAVTMPVHALASLYTGVVRAGSLAAAGPVDGTPEAVAMVDRLFAVARPPRNASFF